MMIMLKHRIKLNKIHYVRFALFAVVLLLTAACQAMMYAGNISASGGAGMGSIGPSPLPSFAFDGLYAVEQDEAKLTPENNTYIISQYDKMLFTWIKLSELPMRDNYYLKTTYTSLDEQGEEIIRYSYNTSSGTIIERQYNKGYYQTAVYLDKRAKITKVNFSIYNVVLNEYNARVAGDDLLAEFDLSFSYADYDSEHIPRVELVDLKQGGNSITPTQSNGQSYFNVSYKRDYNYDIIGYNILDGEVFTKYNNSDTLKLTKEDLESGVHIDSSAGVTSGLIGNSNYVVFDYQEIVFYGDQIAHVSFNYNSEEPYYDAIIKYRDSGVDVSCASPFYGSSSSLTYSYFDYDNYDPEVDPLVLYVKGDGYNNDATYNMSVNIDYLGQDSQSYNFQVSGAELNSGLTKDIIDRIDYVTFSSMFDGSFREKPIKFNVKIGDLTKHMVLSANNSANLSLTALSSRGLDLAGYSGYRMSSGADLFVDMRKFVIPKNVFNDHIYIYLEQYYRTVDNANYYIYLNADNVAVGDLRGATLVKSGAVTDGEPIGLVRLNRNKNNDNFTYTIVMEKDGRLVYVGNYDFELTNNLNDFGFTPLLVSEGTKNNFLRTYYIPEGQPVSFFALGDNYKENDQYGLSVSIISGGETIFEHTQEIAGSDFGGDESIFIIPYDDIFAPDQNSSHIQISLSDSNGAYVFNELAFLYKSAYVQPHDISIDYLELLEQIRELESAPKSFEVSLESSSKFEDEFDVFARVDNYTNLGDVCGGVCGLVTKLEYDDTKIELTSIEALEDFEITEGESIVINRQTGVDAGTDILKMHFRNKTMVGGEKTTIWLKDMTGSDGSEDIAVEDAYIEMTRDIPFRYITSTVFTDTEQQVFERAGSGSSGSLSALYQINNTLFNTSHNLTAYYNGYGFDNGANYNYTLNYCNDTCATQEILATGTVSGKNLNEGAFSLTLTNLKGYNNPKYKLLVDNGTRQIFETENSFAITNDHALYTTQGYKYNTAHVVNGHHAMPRGNENVVNIKSYELSGSGSYTINYTYHDYVSCTESENEIEPRGTCVDDANSAGANGEYSVTVTGAQINAGYKITLPAPESTTSTRLAEYTIEIPGSGDPVKHWGYSYIDFFDATEILPTIKDLTLESGSVLSGIEIGATAKTIGSKFSSLDEGYDVKILNHQGSVLGENDKVGTGATIQILDENNQIVLEYTVKVKGDLSGDGSVTILDLVKAKRDLAGLDKLKGIFSEAGDLTNTGKISITDVVRICRHVAGVEEIR